MYLFRIPWIKSVRVSTVLSYVLPKCSPKKPHWFQPLTCYLVINPFNKFLLNIYYAQALSGYCEYSKKGSLEACFPSSHLQEHSPTAPRTELRWWQLGIYYALMAPTGKWFMKLAVCIQKCSLCNNPINRYYNNPFIQIRTMRSNLW